MELMLKPIMNTLRLINILIGRKMIIIGLFGNFFRF